MKQRAKGLSDVEVGSIERVVNELFHETLIDKKGNFRPTHTLKLFARKLTKIYFSGVFLLEDQQS